MNKMNDHKQELPPEDEHAQLAARLSRIESKLSQLMLHMGLDPAVRLYSEPRLVTNPQVWQKRS